MKNVRAALTSLTVATYFAFNLLGQGTVQFGFEEYPVGTAPPFVVQIFPELTPRIANNTVGIEPFEGQKFLYGSGAILLKSPDGLPIKSFTLQAYMRPQGTTVRFNIGAGGAYQLVEQAAAWRTVEGFFELPVDGIEISGFDIEDIPHSFAIDAVEYVTVPEPQTFWLLTLGISAITAARLKRPISPSSKT